MKFQVKTTALAILVSLGVVGCRSNDTPNQVVEPTPANQASKTDAEKKAEADAKAKAEAEAKAKAAAEAKAKAEAEAKAKAAAEAKAKAEAEAKAKAAAEAKAKAEAEAKRKAEEAKRLEEERKKAEAEAKKLTDAKAKAEAEAKAKAAAEAKAKAEAEAKRKAEEAKRLEEERKKAEAEAKAKAEAAEKLKPVNLVDKNGVEWRIINIQSNGPSNNTTEYRYGGYSGSLYNYGYSGEPRSFFNERGVNAITNLNFNELSEKDGKPFLGVHQGKKEDPDFSGKIVTKVKRDRGTIRVVELEDAKAFNYLYVNQPYSTYGALFTNGHDVKFFSVAQKAEENRSAGYNSTYPVWKEEVVERNGQSIRTGKIIWNDAVAGEATYKGQVIASVTKADIEGNDLSGIRSEPVLDGTVTLKAKFDKDPERNSIEGEINSNLIGKIVLEKNLDQSKTYRRGMATNETMNIKEASWDNDYEVNFYGKDLNDAVGKVDLTNRSYKEIGDVIQYNAVFGATKQPK